MIKPHPLVSGAINVVPTGKTFKRIGSDPGGPISAAILGVFVPAPEKSLTVRKLSVVFTVIVSV